MSNVQTNNIVDLSGGIPTVKGQRLIPTAWVNFNGTGTVSIRDSENVSSITDNGTGDFSVQFAVAMVNSNYCVNTTARRAVTNDVIRLNPMGAVGGSAFASSSIRMIAYNDGPSREDIETACVTILGGQ